jgi:hypothetical protein
MQYRIIKREHFSGKDTICRYLIAQYKPNFLSPWKNIEYFYKSDFEDIPGVLTYVCNDVAQAHVNINNHKKGVNISDIFVYEE